MKYENAGKSVTRFESRVQKLPPKGKEKLLRVVTIIGAKTSVIRRYLASYWSGNSLYHTALVETTDLLIDKDALPKLVRAVFHMAKEQEKCQMPECKDYLKLITHDLQMHCSNPGDSFFDFCLKSKWQEYRDSGLSFVYNDIYDMSRAGYCLSKDSKTETKY